MTPEREAIARRIAADLPTPVLVVIGVVALVVERVTR